MSKKKSLFQRLLGRFSSKKEETPEERAAKIAEIRKRIKNWDSAYHKVESQIGDLLREGEDIRGELRLKNELVKRMCGWLYNCCRPDARFKCRGCDEVRYPYGDYPSRLSCPTCGSDYIETKDVKEIRKKYGLSDSLDDFYLEDEEDWRLEERRGGMGTLDRASNVGVAAPFSIEGSESQKRALINDAMESFGLTLEDHFAAAYGDVFKHGRSFDGCIVALPGCSILTIEGRQSNNLALPQDYGKAMESIREFFEG